MVNGSPVTFSWINNSRVEIDLTPAHGVAIRIERHTPQAPLYLLQNNRPVPAEHFMELALQAMYYAQELIAFVPKGDKGDKGDMGDMNKALYDPNLIEADVFHMDNMVEGSNTKILNQAERNLIASAIQPAALNTALAPALIPARFHIMEFNNTGTHTINWPDWVKPETPVHVMAWGGGGGGCVSGGGGGECLVGWFKRGDFVNNSVYVGDGGFGQVYNANSGYGTGGGNTTVGGFLTAKGGYGGGRWGGRGSYTNDNNVHGGTGGGITGGYRFYEHPPARDSVYGGGCGGDGQGAQGRWYSGGNSYYGGGGGRGLYNDPNEIYVAGKSTFGGDGGERGQNGKIPGGGGGAALGTMVRGGHGGKGKVILKLLR